MNEAPEQTPLDEIISRVDSYIQDPKLATAETLTALKADLGDLKSVMDEEPEGMGEMNEEKPGLAMMIGRHK